MADLTLGEQQLQQEALEFARRNKKAIARELTDPAIFIPEANPVAVFMAGSPGAGKTESSKELLAELESKEPRARILRWIPTTYVVGFHPTRVRIPIFFRARFPF